MFANLFVADEGRRVVEQDALVDVAGGPRGKQRRRKQVARARRLQV